MVMWGWASLAASALLWALATYRAVSASPTEPIRNFLRARPRTNVFLTAPGWFGMFWGLEAVTRPSYSGSVPLWVGLSAVLAIVVFCAGLPIYLHNGRSVARHPQTQRAQALFLAAVVLAVGAFVVEANAEQAFAVVVILFVAAWSALTAALFTVVRRRRSAATGQR